MRWIGLLAWVVFFVGGCASYQYQIVAPDGSARIVPKEGDLRLAASPAELQLRQVDSRCVVLIQNPTTQPISLNGAQSAVVDPTGRSRVIASQLIPPGAYVKLVLPPLREHVEPRGPQIGIGFGMRVQVPENTQTSVFAQYLQIGAGPMEFWEWAGEGTASLVLSLSETNRPPTSHTVRIERSKK
jgi:hypothetical protein